MISRRKVITSGAGLAASALLLQQLHATEAPQDANAPDRPRPGTAADTGKPNVDQTPLPPGEPGKDYTPVITPNGVTLPFKIVGGVKVFHLIAQEVEHEFAPGLKSKCWATTAEPLGR